MRVTFLSQGALVGAIRTLVLVAGGVGLTAAAWAGDAAPRRLPPVHEGPRAGPTGRVAYTDDPRMLAYVAAPVTVAPAPLADARQASAVLEGQRPTQFAVNFVPEAGAQPTALQPGDEAPRPEVSPSDVPPAMPPAASPSAAPPEMHDLVMEDPTCYEDCCLPFGFTALLGLDNFRGTADREIGDNYGMRIGGNLGVPLLCADNIGLQLGATYGLYDWKGRLQLVNPELANSPLHQTFVTVGAFHNCNCDPCDPVSRISWGLAYDWMIGQQFGEISADIVLSQARGQIGYAVDSCNEFGLFGTIADRTDMDTLSLFQSMSRLDAYWTHSFESGARIKPFIGIPDGKAPGARQHRTLEWVAGLEVSVPVTEHWAFFGNTIYGHSSASSGVNFRPSGQGDMLNLISIGFEFNPNGFSRTVCNNCWTPYLPVANNSNFVVDYTDENGL